MEGAPSPVSLRPKARPARVLLTPPLGTGCPPGCPRRLAGVWGGPWVGAGSSTRGAATSGGLRGCASSGEAVGSHGGNNLCNDMWSEVELLTALKEQDTDCSALNYFTNFIGIALPSPQMQQLFATAQRFGAGDEGGSCEHGDKGSVGREDAVVRAGFGWGGDSNIL